MAIELLYFAWVREAIGKDGERVDPPRKLVKVTHLMGWLRERGGGYEEAFGRPERLRIAVDQVFSSAETSIQNAKEIAFFPPVTGG